MDAMVADQRRSDASPPVSRLGDSLTRRRRPLSGGSSGSRGSHPGSAHRGSDVRTALPLLPPAAAPAAAADPWATLGASAQPRAGGGQRVGGSLKEPVTPAGKADGRPPLSRPPPLTHSVAEAADAVDDGRPSPTQPYTPRDAAAQAEAAAASQPTFAPAEGRTPSRVSSSSANMSTKTLRATRGTPVERSPARCLQVRMQTEEPVVASHTAVALPPARTLRDRRLASIHGGEAEQEEPAQAAIVAAGRAATISTAATKGSGSRRLSWELPDAEERETSWQSTAALATTQADEGERVEEEGHPPSVQRNLVRELSDPRGESSVERDASQQAFASVERCVSRHVTVEDAEDSRGSIVHHFAEMSEAEQRRSSCAQSFTVQSRPSKRLPRQEIGEPRRLSAYPIEEADTGAGEALSNSSSSDSAAQAYLIQHRPSRHLSVAPLPTEPHRHAANLREPAAEEHHGPLALSDPAHQPQRQEVQRVQERRIGTPRASLLADREGAGAAQREGCPAEHRAVLAHDGVTEPAAEEGRDSGPSSKATVAHVEAARDVPIAAHAFPPPRANADGPPFSANVDVRRRHSRHMSGGSVSSTSGVEEDARHRRLSAHLFEEAREKEEEEEGGARERDPQATRSSTRPSASHGRRTAGEGAAGDEDVEAALAETHTNADTGALMSLWMWSGSGGGAKAGRPLYPREHRATQTSPIDTSPRRPRTAAEPQTADEDTDWGHQGRHPHDGPPHPDDTTAATAMLVLGTGNHPAAATRARPATCPSRLRPSPDRGALPTRLPTLRAASGRPAHTLGPCRAATSRLACHSGGRPAAAGATALAPFLVPSSLAGTHPHSRRFYATAREDFSSAIAARRVLRQQQWEQQPLRELEKPRHRHITGRRLVPPGTVEDHTYRYCDMQTGAMMMHRPSGKPHANVYLRSYNAL